MENKVTEKISDKMLTKTIAMSLIIILACMSAMALSAYAFFTSSKSLGTQSIISAYYNLDITVDGNVIAENDNTLTLDAGQHTVTMSMTNTNTTASTGFGIIIVKDGNTYHTQQVGVDTTPNTNIDSITFVINLEEKAEVTFDYSWGTSVYYGTDSIISNGEIKTIE